MKRVLALVTLAALAVGPTGCAHKQLSNQQVAKYTVTGGAAVLAVGVALYFGYRQTVDASAQSTYPQ